MADPKSGIALSDRARRFRHGLTVPGVRDRGRNRSDAGAIGTVTDALGTAPNGNGRAQGSIVAHCVQEVRRHGLIQRILVAVKDPGSASLPAVAKAAQLARAFGAELELFHAIDSSIYIQMLGCFDVRTPETEMMVRREYLQRLERIAARVRLHAAKVTVAAEWDYPGYEAIARRAEHIGANLIVAGSHSSERSAL